MLTKIISTSPWRNNLTSKSETIIFWAGLVISKVHRAIVHYSLSWRARACACRLRQPRVPTRSGHVTNSSAGRAVTMGPVSRRPPPITGPGFDEFCVRKNINRSCDRRQTFFSREGRKDDDRFEVLMPDKWFFEWYVPQCLLQRSWLEFFTAINNTKRICINEQKVTTRDASLFPLAFVIKQHHQLYRSSSEVGPNFLWLVVNNI